MGKRPSKKEIAVSNDVPAEVQEYFSQLVGITPLQLSVAKMQALLELNLRTQVSVVSMCQQIVASVTQAQKQNTIYPAPELKVLRKKARKRTESNTAIMRAALYLNEHASIEELQKILNSHGRGASRATIMSVRSAHRGAMKAIRSHAKK